MEEEEPTGRAVVALTSVPMDVLCVRVSATGLTRSGGKDFDVAAGQSSARLALSGLPLGLVTFSAEAFSTACAAVATGDVPDWISDPVDATLRRGQVAQVALSMKRNGRSGISIDFPDDEVAAGDPSQCPTSATSFRDDFTGTTLDPAWSVWEFAGARTNGQSTPTNRIAEGAGALRYSLDPMTQVASGVDYLPVQSTYWYDPGLEVSRDLSGTTWTLDVGVNWYVPLVVNAAGLLMQVHFGDPGTAGLGCAVLRYSNDDTGRGIPSDANVITASCWSGQSWTMQAPLDVNIARQVRFKRANDQITISLSTDGITWQDLLVSDPLPEAERCAAQRLQFSGLAWFNPRGSYADYSYVNFTP
jgi:hypothetical protein